MSVITLASLAELEQIIERGLASAFEVGNALRRIREEELYREAGFDGFVEYLESKPWGISRSIAYEQIEAAQVSDIVGNIQNSRQARELAPLAKRATPEVVKQVYAEVVEETNGNPTAKRIREKVQSMLKPNGREKKQDRPSQYLPDLLDDDSPRNLRTQVVKWCELGRHVESLLDARAKLEPKTEDDLHLIRTEIAAMGELVKKLERSV